MNNQTRLILGRGRRRKKERKQGTGNEIDRFLLKEYTTTSFEATTETCDQINIDMTDRPRQKEKLGEEHDFQYDFHCREDRLPCCSSSFTSEARLTSNNCRAISVDHFP